MPRIRKMNMWEVRTSDGHLLAIGFQTKQAAKVRRDRFIEQTGRARRGDRMPEFVVSRGVDHPWRS